MMIMIEILEVRLKRGKLLGYRVRLISLYNVRRLLLLGINVDLN